VNEPNYNTLEPDRFDWTNQPYGNETEELPTDAPPPKGKRVVLSHWFNANLMHDLLSGKSVTGVFHMANLTPIQWYSKKQSTSKTATYGAEFLAARTCLEQVVDLRNSFRYLGVPVHETSYVWGDNEAQIKSSTIPYSKLSKRHNILSFHYVRSLLSRGFIRLGHLPSEFNVTDTLSKHWSHQSNYTNLIKPLLNSHKPYIEIDELPEGYEFVQVSSSGEY